MILDSVSNELSNKAPEIESSGPKISVDLFLAPHGTVEDAKGLRDRFREADIYAPEVYGWSPRHLQVFRNVSNGKQRPEEALEELGLSGHEFNAVIMEELKIMYDSSKPIIFVDQPGSLKVALEYSIGMKGLALRRGEDFAQALDQVREWIGTRVRIERGREVDIASHIRTEVDRVLQERPDLKQKEQVRVLMSIGDEHSLLGIDLKKSGIDYKRNYNVKPHIFSYRAEADYKYALRKEIDDELAARVMLENAYEFLENKTLEKDIQNTHSRSRFKRYAVSKFSMEEIEAMYEKFGNGENFPAMVAAGLSEKGILIPTSETEIEEVLGKDN